MIPPVFGQLSPSSRPGKPVDQAATGGCSFDFQLPRADTIDPSGALRPGASVSARKNGAGFQRQRHARQRIGSQRRQERMFEIDHDRKRPLESHGRDRKSCASVIHVQPEQVPGIVVFLKQDFASPCTRDTGLRCFSIRFPSPRVFSCPSPPRR